MQVFLRTLVCLSLLASAGLRADPELSGDPITYEENFTIVVAQDAELLDDDLYLIAEEIRYDRTKSIAYAEGKVELTFKELRLIADALEYDFSSGEFTARNFRAGLPPIIIEGNELKGSNGLIKIDEGEFYYGEPGPFTPRISASGVEIQPDESFRTRRARLGVGNIPLLSLPRYSNTFNGRRPEIDGSLGYRSSLGAYVQTEILLPVQTGLSVGANLDLYTERGVLVGPAARYNRSLGNAHMEGHLSTGWIKDQGDVELSEIYPGAVSEVNPDSNRGFILWNNRTRFSDELELVASLNYLDDTDVLRDFRRDLFNDTQDPDSYATLAWNVDPFYVSLNARARINSFQSVVEKLPELRVDLPWIPLLDTGAFQSAHFSAARMRWNPDALGGSPAFLDPFVPTADNTVWEQSRIDAAYGIQRPINLRDGLTLTPLASVRGLSYETQRIESENEPSQERGLAEVGVDLRSTFSGSWEFENEFWDIQGFRHLFQPVVSYRYRAGDSLSDADVFPIDRLFESVHAPSLDLLDSRATDTLEPTHFTRFGIENTLLTRSDSKGVRSLASFNTYYDVYFDSGEFDLADSLYTEFTLSPANWIDLDLFTRWDSEASALDAFSTRITLKSGDLWRMSFYSSYLDETSGEDDIEQFGALFRYQFSQRFGFGVRLRYDNNFGGLTEQIYTIAQRFGNHLELEYGVKFTRGADREDDFGIALRARLINF